MGWSSAEENELSELGSLMVYPIKKLLKDAQHECEQYLWKSKKLTEKPKSFEPELVEFSDYDKSPSERHLTVVGNDESK